MSLDVCVVFFFIRFGLGFFFNKTLRPSLNLLGNLLVSAWNEKFYSFFPCISADFLQDFHEVNFLSYNNNQADLPC